MLPAGLVFSLPKALCIRVLWFDQLKHSHTYCLGCRVLCGGVLTHPCARRGQMQGWHQHIGPQTLIWEICIEVLALSQPGTSRWCVLGMCWVSDSQNCSGAAPVLWQWNQVCILARTMLCCAKRRSLPLCITRAVNGSPAARVRHCRSCQVAHWTSFLAPLVWCVGGRIMRH